MKEVEIKKLASRSEEGSVIRRLADEIMAYRAAIELAVNRLAPDAPDASMREQLVYNELADLVNRGLEEDE